jgi:hypothetical protein
LNCLTNMSSSIFFLISILSLSSEILFSTCSSYCSSFPLLKGLFISRISVWFFLLRFSMSLINSSLIICVVLFNSSISLFSLCD